MSWQSEVDELRRRQEIARQMGGPDRVAKQHAKGRLTVRERLDLLFDQSSFQEIGTLAGKRTMETRKLSPSPRVASLSVMVDMGRRPVFMEMLYRQRRFQ